MHFTLPLPESLPEQNKPFFQSLVDGLKAKVIPLEQLASYQTSPGEVVVLTTMYEDDSIPNFRPFLTSGQPYVVIDHAWFGQCRNTHFRLVWRGFHPQTLPQENPSGVRYQALELPAVSPWQGPHSPQPENSKVLLLTPTAAFARHFAETPEKLRNWVHKVLPEANITLRSRSAAGTGNIEEILRAHNLVIGFNSELLTRALCLGVPAIDLAPCGMVAAFNGLNLSHTIAPENGRDDLRHKSVEEREWFCATLADTFQVSAFELGQYLTVCALLERQRNLTVHQAAA